jgi:hypothetical protein
MSYPQQQYQETYFQQGHQPADSVGYDYRGHHASGHPEYNPYSDYIAGYVQPAQGQSYHDDFDNARPRLNATGSQATAVGADLDESEKPRGVARPLGASNTDGRTRFSGASYVPPK